MFYNESLYVGLSMPKPRYGTYCLVFYCSAMILKEVGALGTILA